MRCTCPLSAEPDTVTADFTCVRRVLHDVLAAALIGEMTPLA